MCLQCFFSHMVLQFPQLEFHHIASGNLSFSSPFLFLFFFSKKQLKCCLLPPTLLPLHCSLPPCLSIYIIKSEKAMACVKLSRCEGVLSSRSPFTLLFLTGGALFHPSLMGEWIISRTSEDWGWDAAGRNFTAPQVGTLPLFICLINTDFCFIHHAESRLKSSIDDFWIRDSFTAASVSLSSTRRTAAVTWHQLVSHVRWY